MAEYAVIHGQEVEVDVNGVIGGGPQCDKCGSWKRTDSFADSYVVLRGVAYVQTGYTRNGHAVYCDGCGAGYSIKED